MNPVRLFFGWLLRTPAWRADVERRIALAEATLRSEQEWIGQVIANGYRGETLRSAHWHVHRLHESIASLRRSLR